MTQSCRRGRVRVRVRVLALVARWSLRRRHHLPRRPGRSAPFASPTNLRGRLLVLVLCGSDDFRRLPEPFGRGLCVRRFPRPGRTDVCVLLSLRRSDFCLRLVRACLLNPGSNRSSGGRVAAVSRAAAGADSGARGVHAVVTEDPVAQPTVVVFAALLARLDRTLCADAVGARAACRRGCALPVTNVALTPALARCTARWILVLIQVACAAVNAGMTVCALDCFASADTSFNIIVFVAAIFVAVVSPSTEHSP
eukprot:1817916-Rhodomonas_salina.1